MTSYDDTKVQLTINRMTQECFDNIPNKSSTELYLISQDPTSIAKIDLDAQGAIESEISALSAQTIERFSQIGNDISALSAWDTTQDSLISELSTQTISNSTDISALDIEIQEVSANMSKSIIRRWEYVEYNGLTFTAEQANSTIAMQKVGSAPEVSLEYTTDGGYTWNDFIVGETTVALPNIGDQMVVRAKTPNAHTATSRNDRNTFSMTGQIEVSGNLAAILNKDVEQGKVLDSTLTYHLCGLFQDCTSLVGSAKGLVIPFETLYRDSLNSLFLNTRITIAPDLPCTSSEGSTYCFTFQNCTELVQAPALPLTTLGTYAYLSMFQGCTSLTTPPPVLPATEIIRSCYESMFQGCTSLTTTPDIKVINTTGQSGMLNMFRDCTSLETVKLNDLETAQGARETFAHVFHGCTSLKEVTLPKLNYTGNQNYCMTECFRGCSNLEKVYLPSLTRVNNSYTLRLCFADCPSLTYVDMGTISGVQSYHTMDYMFGSCPSLEVIDFSKAVNVPNLSSANAFDNTNSTFQIVVPDALYDQWIVASNWRNFASHIVKASEYINN